VSDKKFNSLKDNLKKLQHCSSPGWHREVLEEREKCVHEGSMAFEDWDCVKRELFETADFSGGANAGGRNRKKALNLDRNKRIHLIEFLFESLNQTDPEIEQAWVTESGKRYNSYKQGEIESIELEHLRARIES
jgi:putative addiction module component (TIGR02574 family)